MTDFRIDLSPATAERRLRYFRAMDDALDAARVQAALAGNGNALRGVPPEVELMYGNLLSVHIRLAQVQIAAAAQGAAEPGEQS